MPHPSVPLAVFLSATLVCASARADVALPSVISDHMVLQKSAKARIWGKADPGEAVSVTLDAASGKTTAGADGKWALELDLSKSKNGPFELVVQGKNRIAVADVVVGEVWVASGQSNMEFVLRRTGANDEIAASTNPMLRQFLVQKATSPVPLEECKGAWTVAAPETSAEFTAVGYYFGKKLQKELQTPVGLLHTSWGGTPVEAWTSPAAIESFPELAEHGDRMRKEYDAYPDALKAFQEQMGKWLTETGRENKPCADLAAFAAPGASAEGWKKLTLPVRQPDTGLPASGVIWLRKEIVVPKEKANLPLRMDLGALEGFETVYWDGQLFKETGYKDVVGSGAAHQQAIPAGKVTEGTHSLAIRVHIPVRWTQFWAGLNLGDYSVSKDWELKAESELPALDPQQLAAVPKAPLKRPAVQNIPSTLYGGMIHPLINYTIRGAIWYQGESNAGRAWQYRTAFPLMIKDWRSQWKQGDFPFYFCQLANFQAKTEQPGEATWAELREAQSVTLKVPNTGQAILIDIGEASDIHPRNKKDVGERLAAIALAKDYGKAVPYSGPVYESVKIENGKVRLSFGQIEGGLVARPVPESYVTRSAAGETAPTVRNSPNSELEGFAICGEDKKWVWADAKIDGDTVLVWSDKVPAPVAVRYAWSSNPTCNLYNKAGFPASPFRTDDFPAASLNAK